MPCCYYCKPSLRSSGVVSLIGEMELEHVMRFLAAPLVANPPTPFLWSLKCEGVDVSKLLPLIMMLIRMTPMTPTLGPSDKQIRRSARAGTLPSMFLGGASPSSLHFGGANPTIIQYYWYGRGNHGVSQRKYE